MSRKAANLKIMEQKNTEKNSSEKNLVNGLHKYKFLFVANQSLSGDLAWQLIKEGHEAKMWIKDQGDQEVYDGFFEKVKDWEKLVDWADIVVFDDVGFGKHADELRKNGKLVVGGSIYTDKLEDDREFGQQEMKAVGLNTLPNFNFDKFDEAIKFLKENPGRYVFKPSGEAQDQKAVLFIGQDDDGKDLLEVLEHNKKVWSKFIKSFQLQKFASGVEVAIGAFFNGKDFVYPVYVNFEHKKMFPGDIGPFTGEMGCYDDKTEVLTLNGWKYFKDVRKDDKIATLNPKSNNLEYNKSSKIVCYSHHKKMVEIKNRSVDILVTLDHNMWVKKRGKTNWGFISAKNIPGDPLKMSRTAEWIGKSYDPDKARFFGLYLAEGDASKTVNCVSIAAINPKKLPFIKKILDKTNLDWKKNKNGWVFYGKALCEQLRKYGRSYEKFVPYEIKNSSKECIEAFLEGYAIGDATVMRGGWRIFYTSSKKMADDIQELLLKVGRVGLVKTRNRFGVKKWIKDHWTEQKHDAFEIIERVKKIYCYWDKRDTKIVDYNGKVYCVNVPNNIIYIRRNGKPVWCGNTLSYWSPPNEIFKQTLEKMKQKFAESGYVGYTDINCIANSKGIYPLELTTRFGYPTISLQIEGVISHWGDFLRTIAKSENYDLKTKKGFQVCVVIATPPYPFDDPKVLAVYKDSTILFKKNDWDGVHLGDVKLVDGDLQLAGNSGYALVITSAGSTVEEARKQVYNRVKNIILQNSFYRTDIGVKWYTDSDRLHTWGYLH